MHGTSYPDYEKSSMARAVGRDLPVSKKHCIEICNAIRHKKLAQAKKILEDAIALRRPIPFRRFTNGAGHKPGMAAGQYPKNAGSAILGLLKSLETNAQQKGLNTGRLVVIHAAANRASRPYRASRQRGRRMKNTHLEFVAREEREQKEQRKEPARKEHSKEHKEQKPEQGTKTVKA